MNRVSNVIIKKFGREYDVGFGRWADGGPALFLVNRQTGAVLPVGLDASAKSSNPRETLVTNVEGILESLTQAGIVKVFGIGERIGALRMCRCEMVHPQILAVLNAMEQNRDESAPTRDWEREGR